VAFFCFSALSVSARPQSGEPGRRCGLRPLLLTIRRKIHVVGHCVEVALSAAANRRQQRRDLNEISGVVFCMATYGNYARCWQPYRLRENAGRLEMGLGFASGPPHSGSECSLRWGGILVMMSSFRVKLSHLRPAKIRGDGMVGGAASLRGSEQIVLVHWP